MKKELLLIQFWGLFTLTSAACFWTSTPYKIGIIFDNLGFASFICRALKSEMCFEKIRAITAVLCFKSSRGSRCSEILLAEASD